MATIEPVTRTIVEESFVMTFSRAELQAFVKDPRPFLRDVRHVLNGSQMKPLKSGKRQAARRSAETGKKKYREQARATQREGDHGAGQ